MCELITAAASLTRLPPIDTSSAAYRADPFEVRGFKNEGSGHQFPAGLSVFAVMCGSCSCGLFITVDQAAFHNEREARRERGIRSRGYSEAKLRRALADHSKAAYAKRREPGFTPSVLAYLLEILDKTGGVQFIVHTHHAGFYDEHFDVAGPVRMNRQDFAESRKTLELDTRYEVWTRRRAV